MEDDEYYKRDTNRDTHFQGWAALTWEDVVNKLEFWIDTAEPNFKEGLLQILAQHGYDLALHVMKIAPTSEYEWDMRDVPDLTAWPEPD